MMTHDNRMQGFFHGSADGVKIAADFSFKHLAVLCRSGEYPTTEMQKSNDRERAADSHGFVLSPVVKTVVLLSN